MKIFANLISFFLVTLLGGCVTDQAITKENSAKIFESLCIQRVGGASPWNLKHLYDCKTQSYYIPYQLWTGAKWDGNKTAPCMHKADLFFVVNSTSQTTIKGPLKWVNPNTGETIQVWDRSKTNGSKLQLFTCHAKGIVRVYDSRGERHWDVGRCKFPAGFGWKIGERRFCDNTSIEITSISTDTKNNLESLTFKWWSGRHLGHIYQYAPNDGMHYAWEQ